MSIMSMTVKHMLGVADRKGFMDIFFLAFSVPSV